MSNPITIRPDLIHAKHMIMEAVIIENKVVAMAAIIFDKLSVNMWSANINNNIDFDVPIDSEDLVSWADTIRNSKDQSFTKDILEILSLGDEDLDDAIAELRQFIKDNKPDYCWSFDSNLFSFLKSRNTDSDVFGEMAVMPLNVLFGDNDNPLKDALSQPMTPMTKCRLEFKLLTNAFSKIETSNRDPIFASLQEELLEDSKNKLLLAS